jgi:hypothetical protein
MQLAAARRAAAFLAFPFATAVLHVVVHSNASAATEVKSELSNFIAKIAGKSWMCGNPLLSFQPSLRRSLLALLVD